MNRVTYPGELEQMILWTVLRLGEGAYGLAVRDELERRVGRSLGRGAVYTTLDRLVRKGYVESWLGDRSEQRRGRARRYFRVTAQGKAALAEARDAFICCWSGLESEVRGG
jgi:DNA-binding PadR family transcriptional regulator